MQIRQDRDRIINMLLDQARLCTCGALQNPPGVSSTVTAAPPARSRSASVPRAASVPRSPAARSASSASVQVQKPAIARRAVADDEESDKILTPPQSPRTPRLETPTSAATSATAASFARRRLAAYYDETAPYYSPASTVSTARRAAASPARTRPLSRRQLPGTPTNARRLRMSDSDALFPEPCRRCAVARSVHGHICPRRGGPYICAQRKAVAVAPRRVHYRDEEYADYYEPDEVCSGPVCTLSNAVASIGNIFISLDFIV